MTTVLIIVILTCVSLAAVVLTKPAVTVRGVGVSIFWIVPLAGAVVLTVCSFISPAEILAGLTADTSINPIKILVLFLSMTVLSIYLDEVGFFRYLANVTLRKAKSRQFTLFMYLYLMVSVLTVFTSNDIIILTFTPFICYFTKSAKINPIPFLFAEFTAANTWSMALIIGNPTNVYLATANGIGFLRYASVMLLPTFCGGVAAFVMLCLIFRKSLSREIEITEEKVGIKDRSTLIIGLLHLGLCTVLLTVSSYIGLEMWLISLGFAVSLFICTLILRIIKKNGRRILLRCALRIPWELIPFVLSMFVLVLSLEKVGATARIAELFGDENTVLKYGAASFFAANLMNNIPMSVLFSSVIADAPAALCEKAVFASAAGSNICALFTPIGALAGIMWSGILKSHNVKFSFLTFIKYGALISIPTLAASLGALMLRL